MQVSVVRDCVRLSMHLYKRKKPSTLEIALILSGKTNCSILYFGLTRSELMEVTTASSLAYMTTSWPFCAAT